MWALRAQTDKREYSQVMRQILENTPNLFLREGMATELVLGNNDEVQVSQHILHLSPADSLSRAVPLNYVIK